MVQTTAIALCLVSLTLVYMLQNITYSHGSFVNASLKIIVYTIAMVYFRLICAYIDAIREFRAYTTRTIAEHNIAAKCAQIAPDCRCSPLLHAESTCIVCMEHKRACRFDPCGHLVTCCYCSDADLTPVCPVCQGAINHRQVCYL